MAGVRVNLRGGTYFLDSPLVFQASDSGTAEYPVVWRSYAENEVHEEVHIVGGRYLPASSFTLVTNATVLSLLGLSVGQQQVYQVNLNALGYTQYGSISDRNSNPPMELFLNGEAMHLARYPNNDFLVTGTLHGDRAFEYNDTRPSFWTSEPDLWMSGYWGRYCSSELNKRDWAQTVDKVQSINTNTKIITMETVGYYGLRFGQRYFAFNALSELDVPSEYYIDRNTGILYFFPPTPLNAESSILISTALSWIAGSSPTNIVFEDLFFEGPGVDFVTAENIRFNHCRFRCAGDVCVRIRSSRRGSVDHSSVSECGSGGVSLVARTADRPPLIESVTHCHIFNVNRWITTYRPSIHMVGVVGHISHNLLHDSPHNLILFGGNDILMDYNILHDACTQTGDAGAIYSGLDWTTRGHVIRHNFIYRVNGPGRYGSMAIYFDDQFSSAVVEGNVFWDVDKAVFIGGGRDFEVRNNLFVNASRAIHIDARGLGSCGPHNNASLFTKLNAIPFTTPPWSTRYPKLATILSGNPNEPAGNVLMRNIRAGSGPYEAFCADAVVRPYVNSSLFILTDGSPIHFVNAAALNFDLIPTHPAWSEIGWQRIPMEEMGPKGVLGPRTYEGWCAAEQCICPEGSEPLGTECVLSPASLFALPVALLTLCLALFL